MRGLFEVVESVSAIVAPAAHAAANEADPEIGIRAADTALVKARFMTLAC